MKNLFLATAFATALVFGSVASAQFQAGQTPAAGGFKGPGLQSITVKQALELRDDAPVVVTGKIQKALGNEKYQFSDGTATIVVEIDDDDWRGIDVTEDDTVTLSGEIDKELMGKTEIDVDRVEKK